MEKELKTISKKINLKLLNQLNEQLEKYNSLIEKGKKILEELHSKINEKIKNEQFDNLEEDFDKERNGRKSLRKFQLTKKNIETQMEELNKGKNLEKEMNEENEKTEDKEIVSVEKEDLNNLAPESENYNALKYLYTLINDTIDKIESNEIEIQENIEKAKNELKEGNKIQAKNYLTEKKKSEELNKVYLLNINIYRNHVQDFIDN